jgi:hypothetical protein
VGVGTLIAFGASVSELEMGAGRVNERILSYALLNLDRLVKLFIVSPLLSTGHRAWADLCELVSSARNSVVILTRETGPCWHLMAVDELVQLEAQLFIQPRLHAKVYLLRSIDPAQDRAYVGSANFTRAGLNTNVEAGTYLEGASSEMDRLTLNLHGAMSRASRIDLERYNTTPGGRHCEQDC